MRSQLKCRTFLLNLIDDGLTAHNKLILISAPAGYGKTTLAAEWAQQSSKRIAWLSIDENDNDPARFLRHLRFSLQTACSLSSEPQGISIGPIILDEVITTLVSFVENNRIEAIIFDDYHYLKTSVIHHIVKGLITQLPLSSRIFITTREDPPLPLPRLRSRQQICEIRAKELNFNTTETEVFFNSYGVGLDQDSIEVVNNRTEGWAAGIQLASLSLQNMDKEDIHFRTSVWPFVPIYNRCSGLRSPTKKARCY